MKNEIRNVSRVLKDSTQHFDSTADSNVNCDSTQHTASQLAHSIEQQGSSDLILGDGGRNAWK